MSRRLYVTCGQVATEFRRQLDGGTIPASFGEQFLTEIDGRNSRLWHELHQVDVFRTDESLLTSQHSRLQRWTVFRALPHRAARRPVPTHQLSLLPSWWWWRRPRSGSALVPINEVNLRRARLVLACVTACPGLIPGAWHLSRYVTNHLGQLSLAIALRVGAKSTSQRAVSDALRLESKVRYGSCLVKLSWPSWLSYTRAISERFKDVSWYKFSLLCFSLTLLSWWYCKLITGRM